MQPLNNELVLDKLSDNKLDKSIKVILSTLGSYSESKKCSIPLLFSLKYILISESAVIIRLSSVDTLFSPLSI